MTYVVRRPGPQLAPFVESLWHYTGELAHGRERVVFVSTVLPDVQIVLRGAISAR